MSRREKGDAEKARYWQRAISKAARSGMSIRAFCRQRRLKESQFYWWQRKRPAGREAGTTPRPSGNARPASFALVSDEAEAAGAGIELVLRDGHRLRFRRGVDEETLRAFLATLATIPDIVWSRHEEVLFFNGDLAPGERSIFRMKIPRGQLERVASLRGRTEKGWLGLAPDDSPLISRPTSVPEIYAMTVKWP